MSSSEVYDLKNYHSIWSICAFGRLTASSQNVNHNWKVLSTNLENTCVLVSFVLIMRFLNVLRRSEFRPVPNAKRFSMLTIRRDERPLKCTTSQTCPSLCGAMLRYAVRGDHVRSIKPCVWMSTDVRCSVLFMFSLYCSSKDTNHGGKWQVNFFSRWPKDF